MSKVAAILRAHELARKQQVRRPHTQVSRLTEDEQSAHDWKMFQHDLEMDEFYDIPDKLGKTGNYEPESIYSPAPPSRIRFERPAKRRTGERNERDCELPPDPRRRQTYTIEDGSGRARGAIQINPYSKRITIGGFGLVERKR